MPFRFPVAARNPLSLIGTAIATAMAVVFLLLLIIDWLGYLANPYVGLLTYIAVPVVFVVGLLLIPIGARWASRRATVSPEWPVIDLRNPRQRQIAVGVFALTIVNLVIVSLAGLGSVHYMETTEFCGQVCHTTMEPEYVAHQAWPHAGVECVQCHVGPGAGEFVESKRSGSRRLWHVINGAIPRPVPTPVTSMPRADVTCEQCHWREKFHGDKTRLIREYASDEANSETLTTLRLHVGGVNRSSDGSASIHWHTNPDNRIEYVSTDDSRATIPYVRVTDRQGRVSEYMVEGTTAEQIQAGTSRRMDCLDCHNRPAHSFSPSPERAIDNAIASGALPRTLPFVRREAVAAVTATYPDRAAALDGIARRLGDFYRMRGDGDAALVQRAISASQDAWSRSNFPAMKVTWGTYPNFLGHIDVPGCFRCHDDEHKTRDGRAISQDCELCHTMQ